MSLRETADRMHSRARTTDPETSQAAARKVRNLEGVRWAVYRELSKRKSGLADHELVARLDYLGVTPQRIRTARADLVKSAIVVPSGKVRDTPLGNRAKVWAVR